MNNSLTLICLVHGDDPTQHVFEVKVIKTDTIASLKDLIKNKKTPEFDDISSDKLILWKVNIPHDDLGTLDLSRGIKTIGEKLSPFHKVSKVFLSGILDEHLHIIIERPSRRTTSRAPSLHTPSPPRTPSPRPLGKYNIKNIETDYLLDY
jgi:Crinkler effector protein N-terminal domain